jgi:TetR/AcrR family transcriptional regulator, transcriptional repressor of bet genes
MPKVVDIEERRAELAAAAAQLIARAGVGAATMREVAAEAGWTTGALTHYFSDKRELLLFTFRSSLAQRHANRNARATLDPRAALLQTLEGALPRDDDVRRHWMVTIAFCSQAAGDEELSAAQRDAYREFRDRVAELVRQCGISTDEEAITVAEQLIAVANGIAVQALFDPSTWPPDHQLTMLHSTIELVLPRRF